MPPRLVRVGEALRQSLRDLHPALRRDVRQALDIVLANPESGKALRGELEGLRSFRAGGYRLIYRDAGTHLDLVALGPRRTIYDETTHALAASDRRKP